MVRETYKTLTDKDLDSHEGFILLEQTLHIQDRIQKLRKHENITDLGMIPSGRVPELHKKYINGKDGCLILNNSCHISGLHRTALASMKEKYPYVGDYIRDAFPHSAKRIHAMYKGDKNIGNQMLDYIKAYTDLS